MPSFNELVEANCDMNSLANNLTQTLRNQILDLANAANHVPVAGNGSGVIDATNALANCEVVTAKMKNSWPTSITCDGKSLTLRSDMNFSAGCGTGLMSSRKSSPMVLSAT